MIKALIIDLKSYTTPMDQTQDIKTLQELLFGLLSKRLIIQISVSDFSHLVALINSYAGDHEIWSTVI